MDNLGLYLPSDFIDEIREILGDETDKFIESYGGERYVALRRNPLKSTYEDFVARMPFALEKSELAPDGFYYNPEERPGRHPLHEAGAYYIQEPSAMSVGTFLSPEPGDYVLDLCAAPGGKSTQLAGNLLGEGLLVSNEIIKDRARILSSNIERMGVRNALVLNETSDSLAKAFPNFFDKILVDAPCSGEGMFRKEENALAEWSLENVRMCHDRQLEILDNAAKMLRMGGKLVYSTCTFNKLENEGTVEKFLANHPEFKLIMSKRFWPHEIKGEGHFAAVLVKEGALAKRQETGTLVDKSTEKLTNEVRDFLLTEIHVKKEVVDKLFKNRRLVTFGENVYLLPEGIKSLGNLRVERPGLHIAVIKKNRFEPSHSLALALNLQDVENAHEINDEEAQKVIRGETLNTDPSRKGWLLLATRGFSIAFGKASSGVIKNHYPKGLRK